MILPAIIPRSLADLKDTLAKVSFADSVQIDVVDGKFVENISWPYEPAGEPLEISQELSARNAEIDLMVADPINAGKKWLEAGAKALVFHVESLKPGEMEEAIDLRHDIKDFRLGLSLNNETPLESIYLYVGDIDFIQLMGIAAIGSQGQPFDPRVLERIIALRTLYTSIDISIDGGVSAETIGELRKAGADRFVVGSAILKSADPAAAYADLLKIISS